MNFDELAPYIDQPHEVSVETFAFCNAVCTFCPYPTIERKGLRMDQGLINRLIDEMAAFELPFYFSPFKVNEPLLDTRLFDICHQVTDNTAALLRIFSNGSALTLKNAEKIYNLDRVVHLWISLNEYRPDAYRDLMNLDFERVAGNLDALHETDFDIPVVLSTVGYPNQGFVDYCAERWPDFQTLVIRNGGWLGYTDPDFDEVPDMGCQRWFELSIMANGIVSLCCMDGEGRFKIGDVNKQTLLEVYQTTRDRRLGMSRREVYPCNTCTN